MSDDNNKREFEMLQTKFQIEVDKYTKLQKSKRLRNSRSEAHFSSLQNRE